MNIQTVKELENSYLVNSFISVPKDSSNSDYQKIQEWIAEGNTPEPEFTKEELLKNAKISKITELKQIRDSENTKDFRKFQGAKEIIKNEDGTFTETDNLVTFKFVCKKNNVPVNNPDTIIFGVILKNILQTLNIIAPNENQTDRYSCIIVNPDNSERRGYIKLDLAVALSVFQHLNERVASTIMITNTKESEVADLSDLTENPLSDGETVDDRISQINNINFE